LVRKVILLIISPLSNKENTKKRKKERKKKKKKENTWKGFLDLTIAQYLGLCVCCPTWRDFLCQFNSNSFLKMN